MCCACSCNNLPSDASFTSAILSGSTQFIGSSLSWSSGQPECKMSPKSASCPHYLLLLRKVLPTFPLLGMPLFYKQTPFSFSATPPQRILALVVVKNVRAVFFFKEQTSKFPKLYPKALYILSVKPFILYLGKEGFSCLAFGMDDEPESPAQLT